MMMMDYSIKAVDLPAYWLTGGSVRHFVSLATKHIDDCVVAKKVTCNTKRKDYLFI